jgi:hypothetical protein
MILDRELVEQRALRHLPRTHHRQNSLASREVNQPKSRSSSGVLQHNQLEADLDQIKSPENAIKSWGRNVFPRYRGSMHPAESRLS